MVGSFSIWAVPHNVACLPAPLSAVAIAMSLPLKLLQVELFGCMHYAPSFAVTVQ
jgi:hypothetical protein